MVVPYQVSEKLSNVVHGFFGSKGGVSTGLFTSLNCTLNKGDDPLNVMQNRNLICQTMGIERMVILRQIHKADVLIVDSDTQNGNEYDAMVTKEKGLLLAIQTADCAPILLSDKSNNITGAIHAGWRSAVQGIVTNTISAMRSLGAKDITAAIGPCIHHFEVGEEVFEAADNADFFTPSHRAKHYLFDLSGFLLNHLNIAGVSDAEALPFDTYTLDEQYFSYRRACHLQQPSCGGQLSVIGL